MGKDKSSHFPYSVKDTFFTPFDGKGVDFDAFIAKCDVEGRLQWLTFYGSSAYDEAGVVQLNSKNELYVAGSISQALYPHDSSSMYTLFFGNPSFTYDLYPSYFKYWKNDFPVHFQSGALASDTGSLFILKFNAEGTRLWASLSGPNQINTDSIAILNRPLAIEIDRDDQVYISGAYVSYQYIPVSEKRWHIRTGKRLAVFGPPGAYLCLADTLAHLSRHGGDTSKYDTRPTQFLLKFTSSDSLQWSTYLPARMNIKGLRSDSRKNLYFHGVTYDWEEPFLLAKEGAYFMRQRELFGGFWSGGIAYLAQIDSNGIFKWCTHLTDTRDINTHGSGHFTYDLLVTENDHIILTGGTDNLYHPLLNKAGAFFFSTPTSFYKGSRSYVVEFDEKGVMLWSTYVSGREGFGYNLLSDFQGGFYLLSQIMDTAFKEHIMNPLGSIKLWQCPNLIEISHFNRNRHLVSQKKLPIHLLPVLWESSLTESLREINGSTSFRWMDFENLQLIYPFSILSGQVSPYGRLYITGNAVQLDSTLIGRRTSDSYLHSAPWEPAPAFSGFLLSLDLCDTTAYPPISMGLRSDTLYCAPLSLTLHHSDTNYLQHRIVWNAGTDKEYEGNDYTITQSGTYFVQARNVYTSCPSVYSDTVHIDTLSNPVLHFPQDTVKRCVGEGIYEIHASNPLSTYLWSDGSTDSVYSLRYTGTPLVELQCKVTNACGVSVNDSVFVQFLPPYAYLGNDTILCKPDTLLLDMLGLNASISAPLRYIWLLNGDTVQGLGIEQGKYLIRSPDSGTLIVEVHWQNSECQVAKDTLEFSYYPFPNVVASISDTTICAHSEALFYVNLSPYGSDAQVQWYTQDRELVGRSDSIYLSELGLYTLHLQNYCSQDLDTFELSNYPLSWTELPIAADTFMCQNKPLLLDVRIAHHPTSYHWADASHEVSGIRLLSQAGEYELTLTDSIGCSQSYIIRLETQDCNPILEIPNVFTPNNDGINDYLQIKTQEKIYNFQIQIFNTWGLLVHRYQGDPQAWQWAGGNKGNRPLPDGAYFWLALFEDFKGEKKKESGCVMILR